MTHPNTTDGTGHTSRVWGARARLGLIVPTTNSVNEAEWMALLPSEVTLHTARMPLHRFAADEDPRSLPAALVESIDQLTPARVSCIAYGCTAGSLVNPVESLPGAMSDHAALPCTSTAASIVAALKQLGVTSLAIATPYDDALNRHEAEFLESLGFSVSHIAGLGIGAGGPQEYTKLAELSLEQVRMHAVGTFAKGEADTLLLSCTDMPTLPLIDDLESSLGVPVISSNSATLWQTLRIAGVNDRIDGAGRLLSASVDATDSAKMSDGVDQP